MSNSVGSMMTGKLGVYADFDAETSTETAAFAKRAEQWGYSALWYPEVFGRNSLVHAAWLLANTSAITVATGIANIYARDAQAMRAAQMGLNEQSGGRFLLGMGVSIGSVVSGIRGHHYGKPVATMREYLHNMRKAMYDAPTHSGAPKTVLAAINPLMLALARDEADGAHPFLVPPSYTREARKILGPGKALCIHQYLTLEKNPERARDALRKRLAMYIQAPYYRKNWTNMGFNDEDYENGGSDRLIDTIFAWGDVGALTQRIEEHWEAGADHVCILVVDPNTPLGKTGIVRRDEKALQLLAHLNR